MEGKFFETNRERDVIGIKNHLITLVDYRGEVSKSWCFCENLSLSNQIVCFCDIGLFFCNFFEKIIVVFFWVSRTYNFEIVI